MDDALDDLDMDDEREEIRKDEGNDEEAFEDDGLEDLESDEDREERLKQTESKLQARQWWDHLAGLQGAAPALVEIRPCQNAGGWLCNRVSLFWGHAHDIKNRIVLIAAR